VDQIIAKQSLGKQIKLNDFVVESKRKHKVMKELEMKAFELRRQKHFPQSIPK